MGAREVYPLFYGADPDVFSPVDVPAQDIDVLFYGHGREYRDEWIDAMITEPSQALPDARFAVRGTKLGDLGRAETAALSQLQQAARVRLPQQDQPVHHAGGARQRFRLVVVAPVRTGEHGLLYRRQSLCWASKPGSSRAKRFSSSLRGEEALDRYRYLLAHDSERLAAGRAARERVLKEHTFRHRARQLCEIIGNYL